MIECSRTGQGCYIFSMMLYGGINDIGMAVLLMVRIFCANVQAVSRWTFTGFSGACWEIPKPF